MHAHQKWKTVLHSTLRGNLPPANCTTDIKSNTNKFNVLDLSYIYLIDVKNLILKQFVTKSKVLHNSGKLLISINKVLHLTQFGFVNFDEQSLAKTHAPHLPWQKMWQKWVVSRSMEAIIFWWGTADCLKRPSPGAYATPLISCHSIAVIATISRWFHQHKNELLSVLLHLVCVKS